MRRAGPALLAFLLGSMGWTGAEAPDSAAPLETRFLRAAPRDPREAPGAQRFVVRRSAVDPDLAALRRAARHPGSRLRLDLFPDVSALGVVEQVEWRPGGFSVSGRLESGPAAPTAGRSGAPEPSSGEFLLVVEEAQISGSLRFDDGRLYAIGADLNGGTEAQEIDPQSLPDCAGAVIPPSLPGVASSSVEPLPAAPDPGDQIDVLIAYTARVETAAGGPAGVHALAQRAIDEANRAYVRSGVTTRLRLVWRGRVDYDESLDDFQTHLARLRIPDDGFLDEVIGLRDAAGADVVSLLVDDSEAAGVGYLMQQQSFAFESLAVSVVYWFPAANNLSLAHEIAHNQGCEHDRDHATSRPVFNDAYGWKFIGNDGRQYRTVMGYLPGQRIANFSNPSVFYQGQPTGRPNKENNAHAISATAPTVANFRPHRIHPGSVRDFDGNGADDVADFDPLTGGLWAGLARGDNTGAGGVDVLDWGSLPASTAWGTPIAGDFDGDGLQDLATFDATTSAWWVSRSRGDRFDSLLWHTLPPSAGWRLATRGDFNGDGRDDLASFEGSTGSWRVALSNGSAFASSSWGTLGAPFTDWSRAVAADFNGDGRSDLAVYAEAAGTWWVGLSTGTGFAFAPWGGHAGGPGGWTDAAAGDFTGDGRADLAQVRPADGTIEVLRSTGSGFAPSAWATLASGGGIGALLAADFDGDGLDDVATLGAVPGTEGATWWVGLSTGSAFSAAPWGTLQPAGGWSRHLVGDFDADGRMDVADYLLTRGEWWVGLSRTDHFDFSLWGHFVLPRDDVDTDGDGVADATDCDPTGASAWALPGEVENVTLIPVAGPGSATRIAWPEPSSPGGSAVQYDVLRSDLSWYFDWNSLVCLETNDGVDREAIDATAPPAGGAWFYLVRAGNSCGEGDLGLTSAGTPRTALTCP
ncbi:MAG TPA: FG-GAP-like repeat-containing protein [Candidatus Polarisedimenticolia bacterium]|nr:FG-GAP-like repeat-containing protein [Candidatus Polarisedimenticolia bacterium]